MDPYNSTEPLQNCCVVLLFRYKAGSREHQPAKVSWLGGRSQAVLCWAPVWVRCEAGREVGLRHRQGYKPAGNRLRTRYHRQLVSPVPTPRLDSSGRGYQSLTNSGSGEEEEEETATEGVGERESKRTQSLTHERCKNERTPNPQIPTDFGGTQPDLVIPAALW